MGQGKTQAEIDAYEAYLRSLKRFRTVGVRPNTAILNERAIQYRLDRWREELIESGLETPVLQWLSDVDDLTPLMEFSVSAAYMQSGDDFFISFYSDVGLTTLVDSISGVVTVGEAASGVVQAELTSPLVAGTYYARAFVTRASGSIQVTEFSNTVSKTLVASDDDDYAAWLVAA